RGVRRAKLRQPPRAVREDNTKRGAWGGRVKNKRQPPPLICLTWPSKKRSEAMNGVASEYEFEALPELSAGYESEYEGDRESEEFFGALANLARRGVGWLTAPGSPQRQAALTLAR